MNETINGNLLTANGKRYLALVKEGKRIETEKKECKAACDKELARCGITDDYIRGEVKFHFVRREPSVSRVLNAELIEKKFGIKITDDCYETITKGGAEYWDIRAV